MRHCQGCCKLNHIKPSEITSYRIHINFRSYTFPETPATFVVPAGKEIFDNFHYVISPFCFLPSYMPASGK